MRLVDKIYAMQRWIFEKLHPVIFFCAKNIFHRFLECAMGCFCLKSIFLNIRIINLNFDLSPVTNKFIGAGLWHVYSLCVLDIKSDSKYILFIKKKFFKPVHYFDLDTKTKFHCLYYFEKKSAPTLHYIAKLKSLRRNNSYYGRTFLSFNSSHPWLANTEAAKLVFAKAYDGKYLLSPKITWK